MSALSDNSSEPEVAAEANISETLKETNNGESNVVAEEKRWPGWPGESVFRVLVPVQKVGSIIGRKGEFVKKMCEESRARIKVLDAPPGVPERIVSSLIYLLTLSPCRIKHLLFSCCYIYLLCHHPY